MMVMVSPATTLIVDAVPFEHIAVSSARGGWRVGFALDENSAKIQLYGDGLETRTLHFEVSISSLDIASSRPKVVRCFINSEWC
jgi:hypothetical protein